MIQQLRTVSAKILFHFFLCFSFFGKQWLRLLRNFREKVCFPLSQFDFFVLSIDLKLGLVWLVQVLVVKDSFLIENIVIKWAKRSIDFHMKRKVRIQQRNLLC